jgi:hypothetical protein
VLTFNIVGFFLWYEQRAHCTTILEVRSGDASDYGLIGDWTVARSGVNDQLATIVIP